MPWEAISEVTQIVGACALAISLIYIAVQIRFARLAAADKVGFACGTKTTVICIYADNT